jgi:hypothetical protein
MGKGDGRLAKYMHPESQSGSEIRPYQRPERNQQTAGKFDNTIHKGGVDRRTRGRICIPIPSRRAPALRDHAPLRMEANSGSLSCAKTAHFEPGLRKLCAF